MPAIALTALDPATRAKVLARLGLTETPAPAPDTPPPTVSYAAHIRARSAAEHRDSYAHRIRKRAHALYPDLCPDPDA
jgi:hypothetical protein